VTRETDNEAILTMDGYSEHPLVHACMRMRVTYSTWTSKQSRTIPSVDTNRRNPYRVLSLPALAVLRPARAEETGSRCRARMRANVRYERGAATRAEVRIFQKFVAH